MSSFRSLAAAMIPILALLASLQLLALPTRFAEAQIGLTSELLANVTLHYHDDISSAPAAFQAELYNATAAIFQGSSQSGSAVGSSTGELTAVRFTESFASMYGARCMDGSTYTYYIRRTATQATATKWLIYLQGGSICSDRISCMQRAKGELGSSKKYGTHLTDNTNVASTNATVNPQFHNWNIVYMPYCSGDFWAGSVTNNKTNSQYPFYFTGHNITLATIRHLQETQSFSTATNIVVSGTSAGGVGAMNNVDYFAAAIPGAVTAAYVQAGWAHVGQEFPQWLYGASQGSPDSTLPRPYYDGIDFQVLDPIFAVFHYVYNLACYQHYVVTLRQPSNVTQCVQVPVLYQYVKSHVFIFENKFDEYTLTPINLVPLNNPPNKSVVLNYLEYFGKQMNHSIASNVAAKGVGIDGYFVPGCLHHTTYPTPIPGYDATINGQEGHTVFQGWYNELVAGTLTTTSAAAYQLTDTFHTLPLKRCSDMHQYSPY